MLDKFPMGNGCCMLSYYVLYLKVRRATVLDERHEGLQSSLCVALELVAEEVWHS